MTYPHSEVNGRSEAGVSEKSQNHQGTRGRIAELRAEGQDKFGVTGAQVQQESRQFECKMSTAVSFADCSLVPYLPAATNAEIMEELNRERLRELEVAMVSERGSSLRKQTTDGSLQDKIRFLAEGSLVDVDGAQTDFSDKLTRQESFKFAEVLRDLMEEQHPLGAGEGGCMKDESTVGLDTKSILRRLSSGFGSGDHRELLNQLSQSTLPGIQHGPCAPNDGLPNSCAFNPEDIPSKLYDLIAPNLHPGTSMQGLISAGEPAFCHKTHSPVGIYSQGQYSPAGTAPLDMNLPVHTHGPQEGVYMPSGIVPPAGVPRGALHHSTPYDAGRFSQAASCIPMQQQGAMGRCAEPMMSPMPSLGLDTPMLDTPSAGDHSIPVFSSNFHTSHALGQGNGQGYGMDLDSLGSGSLQNQQAGNGGMLGYLSPGMSNPQYQAPSMPHTANMHSWPAARAVQLQSNDLQTFPQQNMLPSIKTVPTTAPQMPAAPAPEHIPSLSCPAYGSHLCGTLMDMKPSSQNALFVSQAPPVGSLDCVSGQSSSATIAATPSPVGARVHRGHMASEESVEALFENPRKVMRKNTAGEGQARQQGLMGCTQVTECVDGADSGELQGNSDQSHLGRTAMSQPNGTTTPEGSSLEECLSLLQRGLSTGESIAHLLTPGGPGIIDVDKEAELQNVDFDLRVQRAEKKIQEHDESVRIIDAQVASGQLDREEAKSKRRQAYNRREAAASRARKDRELRQVVLQKQKLEKVEELLRSLLLSNMALAQPCTEMQSARPGLRRVSSGNDLQGIRMSTHIGMV